MEKDILNYSPTVMFRGTPCTWIICFCTSHGLKLMDNVHVYSFLTIHEMHKFSPVIYSVIHLIWYDCTKYRLQSKHTNKQENEQIDGMKVGRRYLVQGSYKITGGSTALMAFFMFDRTWIVNSGDSRAVLYRYIGLQTPELFSTGIYKTPKLFCKGIYRTPELFCTDIYN